MISEKRSMMEDKGVKMPVTLFLIATLIAVLKGMDSIVGCVVDENEAFT